jgi:hypothetical protein
MGQFHFHPDEYLDLMRFELPDYFRLQEEAASACAGARTLLELEDPLPPGPFGLVFSVLAIHHLDGPGKADGGVVCA